MKLLAIETSCDETAAAVLRDGREVLSSVVASQIDIHAATGGVIPERAARAHLEALTPTVEKALSDGGGWDEIEAVAVTRGPGLVGCLLLGANFAQSVATARHLPIVGVSHLAGHVYSAWLSDLELEAPYLALVVSGGHTECVILRGAGDAERLMSTRDDAVGEAFDKVARLLGLPYPGGPSVEKAAAKGDAKRFPLPKTRIDGSFSFSGLKTAVRYLLRDLGEIDEQTRCDIAASFQSVAIDQLIHGLRAAVELHDPPAIAVVGGVAANQALRAAVQKEFSGMHIAIPPMSLCTDNAAMIGAAGWHRLQAHGPDEIGIVVDPSLKEFA